MLPIYTRAKLAYDYKTMQLSLIIELASCCNSPEKPIIQTKHLIITVFSKNGQVNQQASADRPVSSLLGLIRTLQLVVDPS